MRSTCVGRPMDSPKCLPSTRVTWTSAPLGGVNLDQDRDRAVTAAREAGLDYPHAFDGKGWQNVADGSAEFRFAEAVAEPSRIGGKSVKFGGWSRDGELPARGSRGPGRKIAILSLFLRQFLSQSGL